MVVTKCYYASGIIAITIIFQVSFIVFETNSISFFGKRCSASMIVLIFAVFAIFHLQTLEHALMLTHTHPLLFTFHHQSQHNVYVSLLENNGESPLLDSRFPDISGKGRGYQLQAFNGDSGAEDWPCLRKVSIWQTVNALEQVGIW